jgi:antitoxin MazE
MPRSCGGSGKRLRKNPSTLVERSLRRVFAVFGSWIYNYMCISLEKHMQVAKWGNSLAVRLPAAVVEALDLKEGDQIEIRIAGDREFEVRRDKSRENALARLRRLRRPLPPGFSFSRDEANER